MAGPAAARSVPAPLKKGQRGRKRESEDKSPSRASQSLPRSLPHLHRPPPASPPRTDPRLGREGSRPEAPPSPSSPPR